MREKFHLTILLILLIVNTVILFYTSYKFKKDIKELEIKYKYVRKELSYCEVQKRNYEHMYNKNLFE